MCVFMGCCITISECFLPAASTSSEGEAYQSTDEHSTNNTTNNNTCYLSSSETVTVVAACRGTSQIQSILWSKRSNNSGSHSIIIDTECIQPHGCWRISLPV